MGRLAIDDERSGPDRAVAPKAINVIDVKLYWATEGLSLPGNGAAASSLVDRSCHRLSSESSRVPDPKRFSLTSLPLGSA
jgi:hypothetical protein